MFPTKEMEQRNSKYAASRSYIFKKKEKDGTEVIGNIVHCKNAKSRLTIENKMVDVDRLIVKDLTLLDCWTWR